MSQLRIDETKTLFARIKQRFISCIFRFFCRIGLLYLLILHFPSVQFSKSEMSFTEKRSILSAAS